MSWELIEKKSGQQLGTIDLKFAHRLVDGYGLDENDIIEFINVPIDIKDELGISLIPDIGEGWTDGLIQSRFEQYRKERNDYDIIIPQYAPVKIIEEYWMPIEINGLTKTQILEYAKDLVLANKTKEKKRYLTVELGNQSKEFEIRME